MNILNISFAFLQKIVIYKNNNMHTILNPSFDLLIFSDKDQNYRVFMFFLSKIIKEDELTAFIYK